MSSVILDFDTYEVWGPNLSNTLMDRKTPIWKKGKWDIVVLSEYLNFERTIAGSDTYQLDSAFHVGVFLHKLIQLVHPERLSLTMRSVHAENLNNYRLGLYLRYLKQAIAREAQVTSMQWVTRRWKVYFRQHTPFFWR